MREDGWMKEEDGLMSEEETKLAQAAELTSAINPARCLGAQIARYEVTSSWIHWLAAFSASIINGLVYRIMPPATPTLVKKHLKDRNQ